MTAFIPSDSSNADPNTTVEWPSEKKNPTPMPRAVSPTLRCCGATNATRVIQPIRCSAAITPNIDASLSHSRGVNAFLALDTQVAGRSGAVGAIACPFGPGNHDVATVSPHADLMQAIRKNLMQVFCTYGLQSPPAARH